jgi:hypothetical protein
MWYDLNSCFFLMNWDKCWSRNVKSTKGLPSLLTMSFLFNVLIAGEARTILLLHIISARPSKQPLMVRTFLKAYMELGSYFVSARTNKRHHHQHSHPALAIKRISFARSPQSTSPRPAITRSLFSQPPTTHSVAHILDLSAYLSHLSPLSISPGPASPAHSTCILRSAQLSSPASHFFFQ